MAAKASARRRTSVGSHESASRRSSGGAGRILLLRHEKAEEEVWLLPGEGYGGGESLIRALQRELWEETGLFPDGAEVPLEGPVALVDSISPERWSKRKHIVHVIFAADVSGSLEDVTLAGCGRARPPRLSAPASSTRSAPSADPAVPAALAARGSGRLPRRDVGSLASSRRSRHAFGTVRVPRVNDFLVTLAAGGGLGCPSGKSLSARPPRFRARSAETRNASASSSSAQGLEILRVAARGMRQSLRQKPVGEPWVPGK